MIKHEQKLSQLRMLLDAIKSDNKPSEIEIDYVLRIAIRLGLNKDEINEVIKSAPKFCPPKDESARLVVFHQILISIYIDGKIDKKELDFAEELGFKLGLNPFAVKEILELLRNNPKKGIEPQEIINRCKTFHN